MALGSMLLGACSETENKNTEGEKEINQNQIELAEKLGIWGTYKSPYGAFIHIQKGKYKDPITNEENEVIYVTRENLSIKLPYACDISEENGKLLFRTKVQDIHNSINDKVYFETGKLYLKRNESEGFKECVKIK